MKIAFRTVVITLLVAIFGAILAFTIVESNKASAVKEGNKLLQRNIDNLAAQNQLLQENKMCIAFERNRPDRQPPVVVPAPMQ